MIANWFLHSHGAGHHATLIVVLRRLHSRFVHREFCLLVNNLIYCIKFNFFIKNFWQPFVSSPPFGVVRRASYIKRRLGNWKSVKICMRTRELWGTFRRFHFARYSSISRNQSTACLMIFSWVERQEKETTKMTTQRNCAQIHDLLLYNLSQAQIDDSRNIVDLTSTLRSFWWALCCDSFAHSYT